jgi:NADH-quinone oxidoreductase subunit E
MLNDEERREIDVEKRLHRDPQGAVCEALKIVQRRRGWVSDESVKDIATFVGVSPTQVERLATFYSLIFRRPVGRHVILICDSVSCWIMGYNPLREHLSARLGIVLGETTSDGRFTLLPVACLGACDLAPAMMVDTDLHGNLTAESMDRILDTYP